MKWLPYKDGSDAKNTDESDAVLLARSLHGDRK